MTRRRNHIFWLSVATLGLVGALFLSVFPTRTWLDQRRSISDARVELDALDTRLAALNTRIEAMDSPDEIERIAREEFGYVRPGEEVYHILPLPAPPISIPAGWPFSVRPRGEVTP